MATKIAADTSGKESGDSNWLPFPGPQRHSEYYTDRMGSQFKQPRAGGIDTPPVGTGAGIRAGFAETRCPGILTKAGETLAYARNTLVREMDESLRAFTRVCVKKKLVEI